MEGGRNVCMHVDTQEAYRRKVVLGTYSEYPLLPVVESSSTSPLDL